MRQSFLWNLFQVRAGNLQPKLYCGGKTSGRSGQSCGRQGGSAHEETPPMLLRTICCGAAERLPHPGQGELNTQQND